MLAYLLFAIIIAVIGTAGTWITMQILHQQDLRRKERIARESLEQFCEHHKIKEPELDDDWWYGTCDGL
jgi:hypothetical protein